MSSPAIYLLFFLSGLAGLVYQVVWVRQFGTVFGNTVHSAALVTGVFMLGLGLGGLVVGRWADRALRRGRSLLWTYGVFEVAIGVLGLLIALALPLLEPLSARFAAYSVGAHGWFEPSTSTHAVRYGVALVLLLPITVLMGGTLPLLIRHVLRDEVKDVGWRVGALFGINTAGAAIGALAVAFALIPMVGLFATQAIAVGANLAVGVVALRMGRRRLESRSPRPTPAPVSDEDRGIVLLTCAAIAISGFAAMGMEIVWFRYLTNVLGAFQSTFGLLLAVMLLAMWLGSLAAGALERWLGRPGLLYAASQALFVVAAIGAFLTFEGRAAWDADLFAWYAESEGTTRRLVVLWAIVRVVLWFVAVPAFMMGFAFPLANALVQRSRNGVGARAGGLYLANAVGAVAGSTLAGFVLIPALGVQHAVLVLAVAALLAIVPLGVAQWRLSPPGRRLRVALLTGLIFAAGTVPAGAWANLPWYELFRRTFHPADRAERLLAADEGITETVIVTENPMSGERFLYTNNHPMSATRYDGRRYMRAFSHLPLLAMEAPEDVLVICFGVGNTAHAASLHPSVTRLEVADLSANVLRHADWFARWNRRVLDDPRVSVFVNDGRQHLRSRPEGSYDLVTLEPPPIGQSGMAALYSVEFYALVKSRLKPGGHLTQWLPIYQVEPEIGLALARAFVEVFPDAVLLSGANAELILVGTRGTKPQLDLDAVRRRLRERPAVHADMRRIHLGSMTEIAGMFMADADTLRAATAGVEPVTDDHPRSEYGKSPSGETTIPQSLIDLSRVPTWCPDCGTLRSLQAYLELMALQYRAPPFLGRSKVEPGSWVSSTVAFDAEHARVFRRSGYVRWLMPWLEDRLLAFGAE